MERLISNCVVLTSKALYLIMTSCVSFFLSLFSKRIWCINLMWSCQYWCHLSSSSLLSTSTTFFFSSFSLFYYSYFNMFLIPHLHKFRNEIFPIWRRQVATSSSRRINRDFLYNGGRWSKFPLDPLISPISGCFSVVYSVCVCVFVFLAASFFPRRSGVGVGRKREKIFLYCSLFLAAL